MDIKLEENKYNWRIQSRDNYKCSNQIQNSKAQQFVIDLTPPSIPTITAEPPYTPGTSNELRWSEATDNYTVSISYRIQASISEDFTPGNKVIQSPWTKNTHYTFANLKDVKYYFRVKSKDLAGHTSEWSNIVYSTQDSQAPQIENFKVTPKYISPSNDTSIGFNDYLSIKGTITESNLDQAKLIITDKKHQPIVSIPLKTKNINEKWPNKDAEVQKDGLYFAFIQAKDKLSQTHNSKSLSFYIDNTSPPAPKITSPKNNSFFKKRNIDIKGQTSGAYKTFLFINNQPKQEIIQKKFTFSLKRLKDGLYTATIQSKDKALNSSESTLNFSIDRTSPKIHKIYLEPNIKDKKLYLHIKAETPSWANIYINGHLNKSNITIKNKDEKILIINKWQPGTTYQTYIRLRDTHQNWSANSETLTYKTPHQYGIGKSTTNEKLVFPKNAPAIYCEQQINTQRDILFRSFCLPGLLKAVAVEPEVRGSQNYRIHVYASINRNLNLVTKLFRCKPFSLFDPRTWIFCIDQQYSSYRQNLKIKTPRYTAQIKGSSYQPPRIGLSTMEENNLKLSFKSIYNLSQKFISLTAKLNQYYFNPVTRRTNIIEGKFGPSKLIKIPKHSYVPRHNRPYFDWIFKGYVKVSQWHGNTYFQKPHYGIDFAVAYKKIFAPANGKIVSAGYDRYGGKCNQGGKYVGIRHDNGMYTYYFHLQNYKDSKGKKLKVGSKIKRGQLIGLSGKSGKNACQDLYPHLHFELRKNRYSSSHINPVPYININWSKIKTACYQKKCKRLSGDNPHPKY